jgi:hypothetical protein
MAPRFNRVGFALLFFCIFTFLSSTAFPQQKKTPPTGSSKNKLALFKAVTCEGIQEFSPLNEAIVFPISIGKVYCFSDFEPVPEKTFIYHYWYFLDKLIARVKLTLKPPRWRTYSTIQLREADKGPWRVEITDSKGQRFKILRFSITD